MTKKTRLIILLVCVVCFFVIAPVLILYSMGDRFDFKKMRITETGGIYVRTFPAAGQILIDSKISEKPGLFSNSIFVQSLIPSLHTVLVKKTGYYDYFKTIPVQEKEVTKLENILLFKQNIQFETITDTPVAVDKVAKVFLSPFNKLEKFIIKNNNLYYSNSPDNVNIFATQKAIPVLKNLVAFSIIDNNIIWLGTDGFLYQSVLTNITAKASTTPVKMVLKPLKINKINTYKIVGNSQNIFVISNGDLLSLNTKTNNLDEFYNNVKNAKISSDGKNIIFYNDNNIYISLLSDPTAKKIILYKSSNIITNCIWLNDSYIIFTDRDKITISEIDYRGEINAITLPKTMTLSPNKKIDIQNPQIIFNQQEGKLYILTNKILIVSEKITP